MNRKKLIELIRYGRACPNEMDMFDSCYGCKYARVVDCDIERLADYLIAHGVTFVKSTNVFSNADRIRAMSDKELTDFICNLHYDCCECSFESNDEVCKLAYWLKQPAKEDK